MTKTQTVVIAVSTALSVAVAVELGAYAIAMRSVKEDGAKVRVGALGTFPVRADGTNGIALELPPTAQAAIDNAHAMALLAALAAGALILLA